MQIDAQVNKITYPRAMIKGQDWFIGALLGARDGCNGRVSGRR